MYRVNNNWNLKKTAANYENDVSQNLRSFWSDMPEGHAIGRSSALKNLGSQLARTNYQHLTQKMQQKGKFYNFKTKQMEETNDPKKLVPDIMGSHSETIALLHQIKQLESGSEEQLIEAAKRSIVEIMGNLPPEMLNVEMMQTMGGRPEQEEQEEQEEEEEDQFGEMPEMPEMPEMGGDPEMGGGNIDIDREIGKRILMNTITHGSAMHVMSQAPHIAKEVIDAVNPQLMDMYERFSNLTSHKFFQFDDALMKRQKDMFEGMTPEVAKAMMTQVGQQMGIDDFGDLIGGDMQNLEDFGIGWSHLKRDEEGDIEIHAKGINFPSLCQEVFKGAMEALSMNGLPQDASPEEIQQIYEVADDLELERHMEQVGPSLWRKFLEASPKNADGGNKIDLSTLVQRFSQESPDQIDAVAVKVVNDPEQAKLVFDTYEADPVEPDEIEEIGDGEERWLAEPNFGQDDFREEENPYGEPDRPDLPPIDFGEVNQGLPPIDFGDDPDYR